VRLRESWVSAARQLSSGGVADSNLEAEVLLRHVLRTDRAGFFASLDQSLLPHQEAHVEELVRLRLTGEPLAYILGHREFYGLDLAVNPHVLIPRQETELLVDRALELCAKKGWEHPLIADIGAGSGAIAIAIACTLPAATIYATDLYPEALAVADANCRSHGVSDRVHILQGDLLEALDTPVNLIVSNPPYISTDDIATLAPEVRREPRWALDGGADGLEVIARLLEQAPSHLLPGGCVILEISPEQRESVDWLARNTFPDAQVSFACDLLGLTRAVIIDMV
jgi:release factor glutamine methyltransferase